MADPTLKLTFGDLIIRVAEFLGIAYYGAAGNEAAQAPVDVHDLDKVKRVVNDGYRRFLGDNERGWSFLTVPLSIAFGTDTVGSDNARYYAPDDFYGVMVGDFTFAEGEGMPPIRFVPEPQLRDLQAGASSSGTPRFFTFRAINTDASSTGDRWEFIFWPEPSGTEVVTARYKRWPAALVNATDIPVTGFQHDKTLIEACLAEAELQVGDAEGPHERAYKRELKRSLALDSRAGAPRLGDYGDRSEDNGRAVRPRSYYSVDTYNGVPVD